MNKFKPNYSVNVFIRATPDDPLSDRSDGSTANPQHQQSYKRSETYRNLGGRKYATHDRGNVDLD